MDARLKCKYQTHSSEVREPGYLAEREENTAIKNFFHAMYFMLVTVSTVGYGDTLAARNNSMESLYSRPSGRIA